MARVLQKSSTFTQAELGSAILVLYQSPPVTPPAQTLFGSLGSQVMALVLPPILSGPRSIQLVAELVLSPQ